MMCIASATLSPIVRRAASLARAIVQHALPLRCLAALCLGNSWHCGLAAYATRLHSPPSKRVRKNA
jgi:hypothetical protein